MVLDKSNLIFEKVLTFINTTNKHIFLSGKAGTGKTTFLKGLRDLTYKKLIIVSPTGIAAVNAEGITIHSLTNLPIGAFFPDKVEMLSDVRLNSTKSALIRELELLVIDEVSMLRADLLDAVDHIFRKTRNQHEKPFGGIQVFYIGDLFQLPPVIIDREWDLLKRYYSSPFFFDSNVYAETQPVYFELEKIYRQSDPGFVEILNSIRNNTIQETKLTELNNACLKNAERPLDSSITLTTHNSRANSINITNLNSLAGQEYLLKATISGTFEESLFPVDREIKLKVGANVMLVKNVNTKTKNYFNGKIGTVKEITNDQINLIFQDGDTLNIEREIWRNIDYKYDTSSKSIVQTEIGTFHQFPLKLAWAVTIHKSQGLTFDSAIIDVEDAFAPGQVYVALSRLRSLSGITLRSPLLSSNIFPNKRIIDFYKSQSSPDETIVLQEQLLFVQSFIVQVFNWESILTCWDSAENNNRNLFLEIKKIAELQQKFATKFTKEINQFFSTSHVDYQLLNKRIESSVNYFNAEISEKTLKPLKDFQKKNIDDINYRRHLRFVRTLIGAFKDKCKSLLTVNKLVKDLSLGKDIRMIMISINNTEKTKKNTIKGNVIPEQNSVESISLQLFKEGMSIDVIAKNLNLTKVTIEKHLSTYIETGEIVISDIIRPEQLEEILTVLQQDPSRSILNIKQLVNTSISFGQISACIVYHNLIVKGML